MNDCSGKIIAVNSDLLALVKLMNATGEDAESLLLIIALGAAHAEEIAKTNNDLVVEFRAHRIVNEVQIILRKEFNHGKN